MRLLKRKVIPDIEKKFSCSKIKPIIVLELMRKVNTVES